MTPILAAFFNGARTMSRHWWKRWLSRTPQVFLFGCRKRGMGSKARRWKRWLEAFVRKFILIFAKLMRRGCATRFPVITDMFVLSDDRIVPRRVAPCGRLAWITNSEEISHLKEHLWTCIYQAASPDNHSVWICINFSAVLKIRKGSNSKWSSRSGFCISICRHSTGSR